MDNQYGNDYNNQNYDNQYNPNMNQYQDGQYNQYDQYNQYNQYDQYDQYNQQPMMQQQPMQQPNMMNQQMNYNQYPNQVDPNGGMMQQPYDAYENPRGGSPLGIILAIIIVIGLVGFLLDYTGTVDIRGMFSKNKTDTKEEVKKEEKKEPEIDYKDKVSKLCSNVNTSGEYNKDIHSKISEELGTGNYTTPDQIWSIFKGKEYCVYNNCAVFQDNAEHTAHFYDCNKEEYSSGNFEDYFGETMASQMCAYMDDNGNYTDANGNEFCKNYTCAITYNEKNYQKACS